MSKITQVQITCKFILQDIRKQTAPHEDVAHSFHLNGRTNKEFLFTMLVNIYRCENAATFTALLRHFFFGSKFFLFVYFILPDNCE